MKSTGEGSVREPHGPMHRKTFLTLSERYQMWGSGVMLRRIVGSKTFNRRVIHCGQTDRHTDSILVALRKVRPHVQRHFDRCLKRIQAHRTNEIPFCKSLRKGEGFTTLQSGSPIPQQAEGKGWVNVALVITRYSSVAF